MKEWDIYGQGVTGLISGYPGQYQSSMSQPNPTPLQTALGTASVSRWCLWEHKGLVALKGYQVRKLKLIHIGQLE